MDEVAYVTGARTFLTGTGNSNPEHPPLAKILIAGGMKLAGDNPFGWRLAGAVFGSLTLVAIFLWTYLLLDNYLLALLAAFLALLNNFLFVIARVAMLDVFYFTFVMWGLVAFTAVLTLDLSIGRRRILLLATGVRFGLGGSLQVEYNRDPGCGRVGCRLLLPSRQPSRAPDWLCHVGSCPAARSCCHVLSGLLDTVLPISPAVYGS